MVGRQASIADGGRGTAIPEWVRIDVSDDWRAAYHDGRLVGSGSHRAAEAQAACHRASLQPMPDSGQADGGSDSFECGWEVPDAITKFGYADAPDILTDEDYAILLAWRSARRRRA